MGATAAPSCTALPNGRRAAVKVGALLRTELRADGAAAAAGLLRALSNGESAGVTKRLCPDAGPPPPLLLLPLPPP